MTTVLRGVPAAPGIATGPAWVYRPASAVGGLRRSLDEAIATAESELADLAARLRATGRESEAQILEAQALMAADEELVGGARARIAAGTSDDAAIVASGEAAAQMLAALDDPLLAARAADVRDVAARIARAVSGEPAPQLPGRAIVVAGDLPPSVTAELDPALLAGIALEAGAATAHAAILARALGIPAVVGAAGLVARGSETSMIGVDGSSGEVWLDPDEEALAELAWRADRDAARALADQALAGAPLVTRDGHRVRLLANVGRVEEVARAVEAGAEGIGLFRTEFTFMGRVRAPSIDEQAEAYAVALAAFGEDGAVVLRLADIGGDKDVPYLALPPEANPFLGVRAIRLAAPQRGLLLDQVRAILRAGLMVGRQPALMAPMVADLGDVEVLHALVDDAMRMEAGDGVLQRPRVGIMVELPSAALLAAQLAAAVDFFSIGTNDLTQYLLAADRTNAALADRQDPLHPAVLRAIAACVAGASAAGIEVAACGEMAGDPAGAMLLLGLGVTELSADPGRFGELKRRLRHVGHDELRSVASAALGLSSAAAVRERLAPLEARIARSEAAA